MTRGTHDAHAALMDDAEARAYGRMTRRHESVNARRARIQRRETVAVRAVYVAALATAYGALALAWFTHLAH